MSQRRAGICYIKVDGKQFRVKGNVTYNLGKPKREALVGSDTVHGFTEKPQVPFIETEFTDGADVDLEALTKIEGATITAELNNGKVIVLREAWYAHEGTVGSEEGNIGVRFEGLSAEEIR